MVIVARYNIILNEIRKFLIESKETHNCPVCDEPLSGYDTRQRHGKESDGSKKIYLIRRLRCSGCNRIHTELPDFLVPRKHYVAEVIESQIDGASDDCPADNSTIQRWLNRFKVIAIQIEGMLRQLWMVEHKMLYPLSSSNSLLESIRKNGANWLTTVAQMIVNTGLWQPTQFACSP